VRHFGDFADSKRACGQCDFCAPKGCIAQRFRTITRAERRAAYELVDTLRYSHGQSIGRLHKLLFPTESMSRDDFEDLVGAMAAAGLVLLEDATFEKADRIIAYRKVTLTRAGHEVNERTPVELLLTDRAGSWEPVKPKRRRSSERKLPDPVRRERDPVTLSPREIEIEKTLRIWRHAEARKLGQPAFCVFSDRTLRAIVQARPNTLADLLAVDGIGPAKVEKFGQAILQICRSR
jgi:superfamily II DNA helicase RecQ